MVTKLTLDRAGRVVLPKPVRDELHLGPGDALELESSESEIVLRPVRTTMPLRKKHGVWVLRTGKPLGTSVIDETIRKVREERDRHNGTRRREVGRSGADSREPSQWE